MSEWSPRWFRAHHGRFGRRREQHAHRPQGGRELEDQPKTHCDCVTDERPGHRVQQGLGLVALGDRVGTWGLIYREATLVLFFTSSSAHNSVNLSIILDS